MGSYVTQHLPQNATPGHLIDVLGRYKSEENPQGNRFVRGRRLPKGKKINPNLDLSSLTLPDVAGAVTRSAY